MKNKKIDKLPRRSVNTYDPLSGHLEYLYRLDDKELNSKKPIKVPVALELGSLDSDSLDGHFKFLQEKKQELASNGELKSEVRISFDIEQWPYSNDYYLQVSLSSCRLETSEEMEERFEFAKKKVAQIDLLDQAEIKKLEERLLLLKGKTAVSTKDSNCKFCQGYGSRRNGHDEYVNCNSCNPNKDLK